MITRRRRSSSKEDLHNVMKGFDATLQRTQRLASDAQQINSLQSKQIGFLFGDLFCFSLLDEQQHAFRALSKQYG
jgi:ABC-type uncharacterized transport system YnjBCD ATPase subunit